MNCQTLHPVVSYCISVMNRLHHLRETLPRSLAAAREGDEFIVLDWHSNDGLAEWLVGQVDPRLHLYQTLKPRGWHHARAKNTCHRLATRDVLVNLDADNWLTPLYVDFVHKTFMAHAHPVCIFARPVMRDCIGRIACTHKDFLRAGGYLEDLRGWGCEDGDLYMRLRALGCRLSRAPSREARAIQHSDKERTRHTSAGRIKRSNLHTRRVSLRRIAFGILRANKGREWGNVPVERIL